MAGKLINIDSNILRENFNSMYSAYFKRSVCFAKSYVQDVFVAEDIASEALIKLWQQIKEKEIDYIEPLLLSILKHDILNYLKHEEVKRKALQQIADWHDQEFQVQITTLEACNPDEIFSSDVEKIVHDTLDKLPEQTRNIFCMSRFDGLKNQEIADQLGISIKTVEYHNSKALSTLRIALRNYLPLFIFLFME